MAEAVVGERTAPPTRFYCHMCNLEINIFNNDFTCPLCSCGFIEELPPLTPGGGDGSNSVGASGSASSTSGSHSSNDPPSDSPSSRINDLVATLLMSRSGLGPMLSNLGGPQELEISIDAGGGGGSSGSGETGSGSSGSRPSASNRRSSVGSTSGGGIGGGRSRQANFHRLDNVFLEFLSSLSSGEDGVFGNSQMFFMGNPGDYAWGREGIDTVVTQLLNHMDTSGPPPLPKEKIAEIPTVEICEAEVEQKLKCSVCWEDFKLQESVRKLPCLHVYHENCIVPWLDLHGTCPICRKSLQLEPSTSCSMHNGAASTSGLSDLFLPPAAVSSDGTTSTYGLSNIYIPPTATASVTVTTSQPGTSAAAGRSSTCTSTQAQPPQPMDTSSPPAPPPRAAALAAAAAAAQGSSSSSSVPGRSNQSSNPLAFEDGNVEYDFD